jgi:hypothetical protein
VNADKWKVPMWAMCGRPVDEFKYSESALTPHEPTRHAVTVRSRGSNSSCSSSSAPVPNGIKMLEAFAVPKPRSGNRSRGSS